jgi:hypothetical protein
VKDLQESMQPTPEQEEIAIKRAVERVKNGAKLPSYASIEEADKAARERPEQAKMAPYSGPRGMEPIVIDFNQALPWIPSGERFRLKGQPQR